MKTTAPKQTSRGGSTVAMHPTGDVHPFADKFPMLDEEAITRLAEHIREHGLQTPIVLDAHGVLVDGRNRLAACQRAGVPPTFRTLPPETNIPAFIIGANVERRHLTVGQRAMATVVGDPIGSDRAAADIAGVGHGPIQRARLVAAELPELVEQVLSGGSLNQAYKFAVERQRQRVTREDEAREAEELARAVEESQQAALLRLQLAVEDVGPEVPIPAPPDLTIQRAEPGSGPEVPLDDTMLRAAEALFGELGNIRRRIQALAEQPVIHATFWPEGQVSAVRSAVSHIVTAAYAIAEKYNSERDGQPQLGAGGATPHANDVPPAPQNPDNAPLVLPRNRAHKRGTQAAETGDMETGMPGLPVADAAAGVTAEALRGQHPWMEAPRTGRCDRHQRPIQGDCGACSGAMCSDCYSEHLDAVARGGEGVV